jgi:hypothetical protein
MGNTGSNPHMSDFRIHFLPNVTETCLFELKKKSSSTIILKHGIKPLF